MSTGRLSREWRHRARTHVDDDAAQVALEYSAAAHSLLLKLRTDSFMGRGASVGFLSCFPTEAEVLFPPLTAGRHEELEFGNSGW